MNGHFHIYRICNEKSCWKEECMRKTKLAQTVAVLALLLSLLAALPVFAIGTPAGTQIKNQATAQYKDENGNLQISTSNEVITVVKPIYGLTVTPNGTAGSPTAQTAAAGATVYVPFVLTNTGNDTDSFNVQAELDGSSTFTPANIKIYLDTNGDGVVGPGDTVITNTGAIPADALVHLILAYDVPSGATAGQFALVNLVAISTKDATKIDNDNYNKTTVVADAVMTISKQAIAADTVYPGSTITYVLQGSNTGTQPTAARTFNIDTNGDGVPEAVTGVLIADTLPNGIHVTGNPTSDFVYAAPAGAYKLYGNAAGAWSTSAAQVGTITKIGLFISGSLEPGQGFELRWVAVVNNDAPVGNITNRAVVYWKDGTGDKETWTNMTYTQVNATYAVALGPRNNPEAVDPNDLTTIANVSAGATVVFTNTVKNKGTDNDVFNITTAWSANAIPGAIVSLFRADGLTPLGDSNSDGYPDTGTLAPNAMIDIVVKITVPSTHAGDILQHDLTITATSSRNPARTDTTVDRIDKIITGSIDLTNNNAQGETAYGLTGAPGTTVSFPLRVTNNNGFAETFALSQTETLLSGWSVMFYPDVNNDGIADAGAAPISSTPVVDAGASYTFVAVVSIPATQTPLSGDPWASGTSQKLTFKATGYLSGKTDTQRDWVEVSPLYSFIFEPNQSGITTAGGTVFYRHVLKNIGTVSQTFGIMLDSMPRPGWTYLFSTDGITFTPSLSGINLAIGASKEIMVKVFVPSNEVVDASDVATIKATNAQSMSASVQDTTTVVGGNLKLTKTVTSVNAADSAVLDQPGDLLEYAVEYKNLGIKQLTEVYIYDAIPLHTEFKVGTASAGAEYSNDNGATWTYVPSGVYDANVTNIRWNIGTVNGGASGTVSFTVRIK